MSKDDFIIFDRQLEIDLNRLTKYLYLKTDEILENRLPEVNRLTDIMVGKYTKLNNAPTKLNNKYNIFTFDNDDIRCIYSELLSLTKIACNYYGSTFEDHDYMIRGWFNLDAPSTKEYDPTKNNSLFHDHLSGRGFPDFHGYYCVNAEPSITYYKIDDQNIYENINKNNRLVLCQNGFPHSRGNWNECQQRITIAYDIVPSKTLTELNITNPLWIKFN
jgi:hypothetical protein